MASQNVVDRPRHVLQTVSLGVVSPQGAVGVEPCRVRARAEEAPRVVGLEGLEGLALLSLAASRPHVDLLMNE